MWPFRFKGQATCVDTRRMDMDMDLGIGYGDIDKARAILEEIVAAHPKVLSDPEPTIRMHTPDHRAQFHALDRHRDRHVGPTMSGQSTRWG